MSEYTPSTWAVLNGYVNYREQHPAQSADEFHRWLAGVKASAFREGVVACIDFYNDPTATEFTNPYKEDQ